VVQERAHACPAPDAVDRSGVRWLAQLNGPTQVSNEDLLPGA